MKIEKLYPLSGGKNLKVWVNARNSRVLSDLGKRWLVTSPIKRESILFENGLYPTLKIIEQDNGTFGILEDQLTWHGRKYHSLKSAYKKAIIILKRKDKEYLEQMQRKIS